MIARILLLLLIIYTRIPNPHVIFVKDRYESDIEMVVDADINKRWYNVFVRILKLHLLILSLEETP